MRTARTVLLLALAAAAPPALAFEGVMNVKMSKVRAQGEGSDAAAQGESGTGRIYLAKQGVRMDWQMGEGDKQMKVSSLMLRSQPDKVYFVNDANHTYSEIDTSKHQGDDSEDADEKITVKKLGNERVAGFDCAHGLVTTSKGEQVEVWASKDVGDLNEFMASQSRASHEKNWKKKYEALKSAGLSGWPMKWVDRRPGRDAAMSWEVTKVEKGAPPAALFDLASYKKTEGFGAVQLSAEQQRQMEEAMKKLTPEQRQQLEKMMKGAK